MKNKSLIGVFAAVVAAIAVIAVLVAKNADAPELNPSSEPASEATASPEESNQPENVDASPDVTPTIDEAVKAEAEKVYTPTFMYFISSADEGFDATNVMIDELKKEYGEKVNFDIRNIDDDPELVKNFPVGDGNTPTLIMLNIRNEISNILFKNKNKNELKAAIDAAMK